MNAQTVLIAQLMNLAYGLNRSHSNSPTNHAARDLHFLAGKLARLLLSGLVELVHSFVIAIGEHEFAAAFDACQRATLIVTHARHVFESAHAVADVTDQRRVRTCPGISVLSNAGQ